MALFRAPFRVTSAEGMGNGSMMRMSFTDFCQGKAGVPLIYMHLRDYVSAGEAAAEAAGMLMSSTPALRRAKASKRRVFLVPSPESRSIPTQQPPNATDRLRNAN